MAGTKWTRAQEQVLRARNHNILVAAAAGSGKTAVLVERIIQMICDEKNGVDIDQLLIVTFTNAAAGEMRARIGSALEARLETEGNNAHIQKQLMLLQSAHISTIHGFCLFVIRNYFHAIGLEPGLRVGDENEVTILKSQVLNQLLEDAYERADENFLQMVESFAGDKSDRGLEKILFSLYDQAMASPSFSQWKKRMLMPYECACVEEMEQSEWMKNLLETVRLQVTDTRQILQNYLEKISEDLQMEKFADVLAEDLQILGEMAEFKDYRTFYRWEFSGGEIGFRRNPAVSKKDEPGLSERKKGCQNLRKKYLSDASKGIAGLRKKYFSFSAEEEFEKLREMEPAARALLDLLEEFRLRFRQAKQDKGIMDFNDQEQYALEILAEETEDGFRPSEVARELRGQFAEIIIDEYQDSNDVQEQILTSVSTVDEGKPNIFMVGDVKQSIYRFRMAKPALFTEKYDSYEESGDSDYQKIELQMNFRSRESVLENTNYIFERIMHKEFGKIAYDDGAALHVGREFPECAGQYGSTAELIVGEKPADMNSTEMEARMVANRIRCLVQDESFMVLGQDGSSYRPVEYGDITVLHRSPGSVSPVFKQVFAQEGIPFYTDSEQGYFDAVEVQTILHLLRIIDNPRQDIPMAAVLRSEIGGFSDDELAQVSRAKPRGKNLYDGLKKLEKGRVFLKRLQDYREKADFSTVPELLEYLYTDTAYPAMMAATDEGERRNGNLMLLVAKAQEYAEVGETGVFHFLRYMDALIEQEKDFGEYATQEESRGCVHFMSIHKSKGLEFPVVIVSGLGRKFNLSDSNGVLISDAETGMGMKYVNLERRYTTPMALQKVLQNAIREESLAEELRVLYVALTRAKEKLIMTGVLRNASKAVMESAQTDDYRNHLELTDGQCFLDWILPACSRNAGYVEFLARAELDRSDVFTAVEGDDTPDELKYKNQTGLRMTYVTADDLQFYDFLDAMLDKEKKRWLDEFNLEKEYDEAARDFLVGDLSLRSELQKESIPVKASVTELKKLAGQETEFVLLPEEPVPDFVEKKVVTGAEVGTLYHGVLEHLEYPPLEEYLSPEGHVDYAAGEQAAMEFPMPGQDRLEAFVETELRRQMEKGYFTPKEKKKLRGEKIVSFLQGNLGRRMWQASYRGCLHRETPFVIGVPVEEVYPDRKDDGIFLVQGIIDAYFETNQGIVLVDYKTDSVAAGQKSMLVERYRVQLDRYQQALEKLTGRPVVEKYIYSISLDEAIEIH